MIKESYILIFGTILSIATLIGFKTGHFYLHGLCNCLSGKLFEYVIPLLGLVSVIFLTNGVIVRLIKQREAASENVKKAYETMNGISRVTDVMLSNLQLNKIDQIENYMKICGIILGTEGVKLKNMATVSFVAFINKQKNSLEGNVIYKRGNEMVVDDETIHIDINSRLSLTKGIDDVIFSNWYDTVESLEKYQVNFEEKIRQKIGIIKNFTIYKIRGFEEGVLIFLNYENDIDQYDADIVKDLVGHVGSLYSITIKQKENVMLQYLVMRKLADLAERRDHETGKHLLRIQSYCRFIAETLSAQEKYKEFIDAAFIEDIYYSSPLHDIGKVGIEDRILLKPGKLTQDEMAVMKTHTLIGAEILKGPAFLKMGQDIAHYHHEKWDGTGYPEGLTGEEIPLSARIVKLADVYDALVSKRVYKESFNQEKAESIIQEGIGSHFDPDICIVFMEYRKKFIEIRDSFRRETGKLES
ncbi:MAG: HD domain-containing protein [Candidatus Brocadiaceae bacterium]|nr:HD domain-containing protein [Candidatus Brocadiaceae bacterium]